MFSYPTSSLTDFEIILNSFGGIVEMGVNFLKYFHIGALSLFDIIIAMIIIVIVGWLIDAAHTK